MNAPSPRYDFETLPSEAGFLIQRYPIVDSTQVEAERFLDPLDATKLTQIKTGIVFLADSQTHGRGSFHKKWVSEPGGLYYSLLVEDTIPTDDIQPYIDQVGRLTASALSQETQLAVQIEHPNDIMVANKKIGGILITRLKKDTTCCLIIGIGLNLMQKKMPEDLQSFTTSVHILTQKSVSRMNMVNRLTSGLVPLFSLVAP